MKLASLFTPNNARTSKNTFPAKMLRRVAVLRFTGTGGKNIIGAMDRTSLRDKVHPSVLADMEKIRSEGLGSIIGSGGKTDFSDILQSLKNGGNGMKIPGGGGMGMGMMAFGMGENEKGKKVARAASMRYDPSTGQMKSDFKETQLEPDDEQLASNAPQVDMSNVTEVEFEEDKPKKH